MTAGHHIYPFTPRIDVQRHFPYDEKTATTKLKLAAMRKGEQAKALLPPSVNSPADPKTP